MESVILKHDGYIWGPWAVWKMGGGEGPPPSTIHCRFVSKSIFGEVHGILGPFLIDLKQNYDVVSVRGREIKMRIGVTIIVDIHGAADEMRFMEETDFTCNLIDIRRTGIHLRSVPTAVAYEVSPFDTVLKHIQEKTLVPVNVLSALKNYRNWPDWKADFICDLPDECSVCQTSGRGYITPCGHGFHVDCLAKWLEKAVTCPMCRERIL